MLKRLLLVICIAAVVLTFVNTCPCGCNKEDHKINHDSNNEILPTVKVLGQHLPVRTSKCSYELFIPSGYSKAKKYPLFVTLSPGGNGRDFEKSAGYVCNKMGFIMVGSNDFRNGVPSNIVLPKVDAMIADVSRKYSVDKSKIYIGGFSGGGMGSYFMAVRKPGFFKGLVINNGRIHPSYLKVGTMRKMRVKRVAIMSSDADNVVKRSLLEDQARLLRKAGVTVKFIKWKGGHSIAPSSIYEQALKWVHRGY